MSEIEFENLPDDPDAFKKDPLPLDPSTRTGTLANGLRYFIAHASKPKNQVAMALAVDVGSLVEEEHERGVAHILEHLAFNATEKYSNHDIIRFLESIGAEFGACQNAQTSFDETVYELLVPSSDIAKGLSVFAQFASHIRCDPEDLKKERGPVLEEYRGTRSVEGRAMEKDWKIMCQGCKYADRLPIGLESIIRNVSAQTVRDFYRRWYTPQNMAVILVGPIADADAIVRDIEEHMSSITAHADSVNASRNRVTLPEHSSPRFHTYVDKEQQDARVEIVFQRAAPTISTTQNLKDLIIEELFQFALNNRLFRISRRRNPPFYDAMTTSGPVTRTILSSAVGAVVEENGHQVALKTLLIELARARLHGFAEYELDAARAQHLSDTASTYRERNQVYSTDLREEYVRHFLTGELVVGREKEAKLTKTLLPTITMSDLIKHAEHYQPSRSCVIKAASHVRAVSDQELEAVVREVERMEAEGEIDSGEGAASNLSILPELPTPGRLVDTRDLPYVGAKEIVLANGMKVCCKNTGFLGDQILVSGIAQGGLSEVEQKDFRSCSYSFKLAKEVGQFGHPPEELAEMLMGQRVGVSLGCGTYTHQFSGEQSPANLETCFQLIHRLFAHGVHPAEGDLETGWKYLKESIVSEVRNPMKLFMDRARLINHSQASYLWSPMTLAEMDKIEPDVAFRFFNDCFKNPAQFTICLTGSYKEEELQGFIERYLASLPARDSPAVLKGEDITAVEDDFPKEPVVDDVRATMTEPQGVAFITVPVSVDIEDGLVDQRKIFTITFCGQLLETRLLRALRFKFGKVYSVSVSLNWRSAPSEMEYFKADLAIAFTCDPSSSIALTELAIKELDALQAEACTSEELDALLSIEQQQWDSQQEENSFWHSTLVNAYSSRYYRKTGDLEGVVRRRDEARADLRANSTPETLLQGFRTYLPYPARSRYTAITFSPSKPLWQRWTSAKPQQKTAFWAGGLVTVAAAALLILKCLRWRR